MSYIGLAEIAGKDFGALGLFEEFIPALEESWLFGVADTGLVA